MIMTKNVMPLPDRFNKYLTGNFSASGFVGNKEISVTLKESLLDNRHGNKTSVFHAIIHTGKVPSPRSDRPITSTSILRARSRFKRRGTYLGSVSAKTFVSMVTKVNEYLNQLSGYPISTRRSDIDWVIWMCEYSFPKSKLELRFGVRDGKFMHSAALNPAFPTMTCFTKNEEALYSSFRDQFSSFSALLLK